MYTHKFKVFANIVYPVQKKKNHIRNNYEMILTKMIKNDKRTLKNKIHSTLIYVFTYYFGHISYFASFYFALTQYIHDID